MMFLNICSVLKHFAQAISSPKTARHRHTGMRFRDIVGMHKINSMDEVELGCVCFQLGWSQQVTRHEGV